ncbi:MAG: endolytic transglycosylase MltG [Gammaproteobacteria bacterium]|nr:endolytic transglycosylase MltG [Gammaproteobacteria bacterium]
MVLEKIKEKTLLINRKRILLWLYIILACGIVRGIFFFLHINSPLQLENDYPIEVVSGTTFNRLVTRLAGAGITEHAFDMRLYGRLSGRTNEIKAGEYVLNPGTTHKEFLEKLVAGDVITHQTILVEGWTLKQALDTIQSNPMVTITLDSSDQSQLQSLLNSSFYPEGLVFPDTYNFSRGTNDSDLLLRAHDLMQVILEEEWAARDVGLPYETPYEALIMASIIERETGLASERQQIAGVFIRRLQLGMRLQTDPTVIYGLGSDFDGDLTRADLQRPSPFNTYLNSGLPPTPIALPGRESIFASLHPDQGDTLYFVARGDGSHYFSSTLEEHQRAVEQYQLGN